MGIFVKFWLFYDARSLNMVMPRDSRCKSRFFLFCSNSTFNIRESHKISSGKALYFRSYQQKTSRGWGGKHSPPSVPLGLTNFDEYHCHWHKCATDTAGYTADDYKFTMFYQPQWYFRNKIGSSVLSFTTQFNEEPEVMGYKGTLFRDLDIQ